MESLLDLTAMKKFSITGKVSMKYWYSSVSIPLDEIYPSVIIIGLVSSTDYIAIS